MILYHGTNERAARAIETEGFYAGSTMDDAGNKVVGGVFFADNEKHANAYGEFVIEMWLPDEIFAEAATVNKGTGPYGDDEIIISDEIIRAEGIIEDIIELGQKYWAELGY